MMTITVNDSKQKWILKSMEDSMWWNVATVFIDPEDMPMFAKTFRLKEFAFCPYTEDLARETISSTKAKASSLLNLMYDHEHAIKQGMQPGEQQTEFIKRLFESFIRLKDFWLSRVFHHTTVEEMETTRCTKPHCNCIEEAEKKAGGPVKNYQCLAPSEQPRMKSSVNLDHYAELEKEFGNVSASKKPHQTATIDEQIEFMETVRKTLVVPFKFEAEIGSVINTLRTSKVFEHQRMLIQNIDFEGVIEKLIRVLKSATRSDWTGYVDAVTNAEAALGMIDAFKQKSSPKFDDRQKDIANAWTSIVNYDIKRKELVKQIALKIGNTNEWGEAEAIIYAIEEMEKLKAHGLGG